MVRRSPIRRPLAPIIGLLLCVSIVPAPGCGGSSDGPALSKEDEAIKRKLDRIEQIKKENAEVIRKKSEGAKR